MTVFDTRRFLIQKLKEVNPDFETRSGSAGGTILVKPFAVWLNALEEELDFIRTQLSLENVADLTSDNVDQLITNLFIDRRTGEFAQGSVRIFYSSAQDATIVSGTGFLDTQGQLFVANGNTTISQAEMTLNRDGSLFYVDVPVIASDTGDSFNIDENSIVSLESDLIGVIRVTNPNPIVNGLPTETDSELVERAQLAITIRNLINRRSITTVLLNEFNTLVSVQPIGFRDPEMIRDLIEVVTTLGPTEINIGGHADIYIEPNTRQSVETQIPASAMTDDLIISMNVNRGLVTNSVKPGLFVDIAAGFFGVFEVQEQFGVALSPSDTTYIYIDGNGVLQIDDVATSFPSSSIPLATVTTDAFNVTSIVDARTNLVEFTRPAVLIDSIVELDPVSLTPSDRTLTDGFDVLTDTELDTDTIDNPNESESAVSVTGDVFTVFTESGEVYVAGYDEDGTRILDPVNVSLNPASVARNPSVSIDASGKLLILFEDDRAGQFDVHFSRLDQTGAVEIAVTSPAVTAGISDMEHDTDESGNVHVTYVEGTDLNYTKLDNDGAVVIAATTISGSSNPKANPDISTNGNNVTTSLTGSADGTATLTDTITGVPGSVVAGQTLVLTGGSLDYSAIMDGTETEPGAFAATLTGTVSDPTMDTSTVSGNNTFEVTVDGVVVSVTFADTTTNPIATVISDINVASNATALAASIATNSGSDEVVITSPTTGLGSTVNITGENLGLGFALGENDQGGSGYDTSISSGNNVFELDVDEVPLAVTFTDTRGNTLVNVLSEINAISNASTLATDVAFDGGGIVQIVSPTTGVASTIEITLGNAALGFVTGNREEGGNELGRRIGVLGSTATTISLAEIIRTVSTVDDIEYRVEAIEAAMAWEEDDDIYLAKIDDTAAIFVAATNLTHEEVQASQLAVPAGDALTNGPGANEITLDDTAALFITNQATVGDTVRVTTATPSSAEADYLIKDIVSEVEVVLIGTLPSSPANTVTYEVFRTLNSTNPQLGTNSDNETQLVFIDNERAIKRIELDRLATVTQAKAILNTRPSDVSSLNMFVDVSDNMNLSWVERDGNSGDPHLMKVNEFGDITLSPVELKDTNNNSAYLTINADPENRPYIIWTEVNTSGSTTETSLHMHRRSAQDYFLRINDPALRLSEKEDVSIIFTKEFLDHPIQVNYQSSSDVRTVEDFVQDPSNQIIDSNYLVKHVIPAITSMSIQYEGEVTDAQSVVIDFINGVTGTELEASDIADALYEAGATHVIVPFTMTTVYNDVDGARFEQSSQDTLTIPRVGRFLATASTITVTDIG